MRSRRLLWVGVLRLGVGVAFCVFCGRRVVVVERGAFVVGRRVVVVQEQCCGGVVVERGRFVVCGWYRRWRGLHSSVRRGVGNSALALTMQELVPLRVLCAPRWVPRHLANDPFQMITVLLPVHGRGRQVCPESGDIAHKVFALEHELAKFGFRKRFLVRASVHQAPSSVAVFPKCGVEERPCHALALSGGQKPSVEVAELMLHVIHRREIGA